MAGSTARPPFKILSENPSTPIVKEKRCYVGRILCTTHAYITLYHFIMAMAVTDPCNGRARVTAVSAPCQRRVSTVSSPCQRRVSAVSVPCQRRVSAVSAPCQRRFRAVSSSSLAIATAATATVLRLWLSTLSFGSVRHSTLTAWGMLMLPRSRSTRSCVSRLCAYPFKAKV